MNPSGAPNTEYKAHQKPGKVLIICNSFDYFNPTNRFDVDKLKLVIESFPLAPNIKVKVDIDKLKKLIGSIRKNEPQHCKVYQDKLEQYLLNLGVDVGSMVGLRRPYTYKDVDRLKQVFEKLKFEVECHEDLTSDQMITKLTEIAHADLSDYGCFVCVLSSHGYFQQTKSKQGDKDIKVDVIQGNDMIPVTIDVLTDTTLAHKAPHLKHKPKIFLLQHCRGRDMPGKVCVTDVDGRITKAASAGHGTNETLDQEEPIAYKMPVRRDFFIHYPTTQGNVSWKQGRIGTPFLQAWCDVLEAPSSDREIHQLATIVNRRVCEDYETKNNTYPEYHGRKETPQFISSLYLDFNFPQP